jgi:hypothetical protein
MDRREGRRRRQRAGRESRKNLCLLLAEECRERRAFQQNDIVFEVLHNFVALSQWGNTIFGIMSRLTEGGGDPAVRAALTRTMSGNYDNVNATPYTPIELFVIELFRTISPNRGSISATHDARNRPMAPRRMSASGCVSGATSTSARRRPPRASTPRIGRTRSNASPIGIRVCRQARRSTRGNAVRSALSVVRSTSRPGRSATAAKSGSATAVSARCSV